MAVNAIRRLRESERELRKDMNFVKGIPASGVMYDNIRPQSVLLITLVRLFARGCASGRDPDAAPRVLL
jgi:hypothetical protein